MKVEAADVVIKRNEEYIAPEGNTRPVGIVAAAVLQDGRIWTGRRHPFLFPQIYEDGGKKALRDQQGFLTDDGRFVTRKAARDIAIEGGQVKKEDIISRAVFTSEDLW